MINHYSVSLLVSEVLKNKDVPDQRDSKIKAKMKARKKKIRDLGYKWTQSWA